MGHLCPRELYLGEPGGRASLLVTPKDMLSKAQKMGVCFHKGPAFWGAWRDAPFLGPLREWMNLFI
jgi:hypothetical protein